MNERSFIVKSLSAIFRQQSPPTTQSRLTACFPSRSPFKTRSYLTMRHVWGQIWLRRWFINRQPIGLLSKLPDRNNRAQTYKRVNNSFHDAPALLFRLNQEPVCRLSFVIYTFILKTPPSSHFV